MQYFSQESLQAELRVADFDVVKMVGELIGEPLQDGGDFIGVIASAARR
jgi:hypothetical protein